MYQHIENIPILDPELGQNININNDIRLLLEPDKQTGSHKYINNYYTSKFTLIIAIIQLLLSIFVKSNYIFLCLGFTFQFALEMRAFSIINSIDHIINTGKLFRSLLSYWIIFITIQILETLIMGIYFVIIYDEYTNINQSSIITKCIVYISYFNIVLFHFIKNPN